MDFMDIDKLESGSDKLGILGNTDYLIGLSRFLPLGFLFFFFSIAIVINWDDN